MFLNNTYKKLRDLRDCAEHTGSRGSGMLRSHLLLFKGNITPIDLSFWRWGLILFFYDPQTESWPALSLATKRRRTSTLFYELLLGRCVHVRSAIFPANNTERLGTKPIPSIYMPAALRSIV